MSREAWAGILAAVIAVLFFGGKRIMNRAEFKRKFLAETAGLDTNRIPILLLMAVAAYESGDGTGAIAQKTNNIFSITSGKSWKGPTYKASTGYTFRVYGSWRESAADFVALLKNWPTNYGRATAAGQAGDLEGFARALQAAGYGDPGKTTYAAELVARSKAFSNLA